MNLSLLLAGVIAVAGAVIHGVIGDRFVRSVDPAVLTATTFARGRRARFLLRVSWHLVTLTFAVMGVALTAAGAGPSSRPAAGVAAMSGVMFTAWAGFVVAASALRGGVRGLVAHPAPIMMSLAAVLIWVGAAQL